MVFAGALKKGRLAPAHCMVLGRRPLVPLSGVGQGQHVNMLSGQGQYVTMLGGQGQYVIMFSCQRQ